MVTLVSGESPHREPGVIEPEQSMTGISHTSSITQRLTNGEASCRLGCSVPISLNPFCLGRIFSSVESVRAAFSQGHLHAYMERSTVPTASKMQ